MYQDMKVEIGKQLGFPKEKLQCQKKRKSCGRPVFKVTESIQQENRHGQDVDEPSKKMDRHVCVLFDIRKQWDRT